MNIKSQYSVATAQYLLNSKEEKYCGAIIHCYYYGVLQYMKYTLNNLKKDAVEYAQQEADKTIDSHEYVFKNITDRLNANPRDMKKFKEGFRALKKTRVAVDYTSKLFTIDECLNCKELADGLIASIKRYFNSQIA